MKYLMSGRDPFSVIHHPWQPGILALHLMVVPILVFALGLIAREHVIGRLLDRRARAGRGSGIGVMLLAVPMIASGYLMQVLTDPVPRKVLALVHSAAGTSFALLYLAHLAFSRPLRRLANGRAGTRRRRPRHAVDRRLDWLEGLGLQSASGMETSGPAVETTAEPERRRP